ncbi:MAG: nuclear transport factor 2 family protein [Ignavibacteria bacterium]|nr:nuclear transport factor 2 family protein [Ignavibacteria bacterium]
MPRTELIQRVMDSIDKMDAKTFSEFITEDGVFKYANNEPVKGRENIKNYVDGFFKMIRSGKHNIINLWDNGDSIVWQGEVTYTRHDEKEMTFPFVNVFYMKGDMITDYLIHIDNTPLFAA